MEDLEGFLMDEGLEIWPGCLEFESSFSSSLDAWWNGQISELEGCDLDLFSPLEESDLAHQQQRGQIQVQPQQREQEEEEERQQQQQQGDRFLESEGFDSELFSLLEEDGSTPRPSSSVVSINQIEQQQQQEQSNDEEEDEDEDEDGSDKKGNAPNSKNLVSERNRRKRLNQQLFTLRSLVPNITKMDKRSILVDALAYLQSILQQIEREKENTDISADSSCNDSSLIVQEEIPPMQPAYQEYVPCNSPPALSQIEVEMLDEQRFVLKISCNRAMGALSQVQRLIESMGLESTSNSINQLDNDHMRTTTFFLVKKKGVVTEEKLKNRAKIMALKLGLLANPQFIR